jgi:hypothetical protein
MNKKENLEPFHKALDDDKGLKSKRQMMMYVALITLALTLSAATIKEANTFLFKLDFLKPEGLMALLFMANFFCFIRYQNYSTPHEDALNKIWQTRLLSDSRVTKINNEHRCYEGILGDIYSDIYDHHSSNVNPGEEPYSVEIKYKNRFIFFRYLIVSYDHREYEYPTIQSYNISREIDFFQYLKLLWVEVDLRGHFMINNRETLDLLAPKLISIFAFLSVLMRDKLYLFTDLFFIVPQ